MSHLVLSTALLLGKATLLLIVALAAATSLRRSTAGARHLVWLATLAGLVALPLLARVAPLQVPLLPAETAAVSSQLLAVGLQSRSDVPSATPTTPTPRDMAPTSQPTAKSQQPTAESINLPSPLTLAALLWASVAFGLLAWLAMGAVAVARIIRTAVPLDGDEWNTPLYEVADRLELEDAPRLVASDRVEMAFACGILKPTIVLPSTAHEWSDDRRRAVLFHELAHVRRKDLLGHTLGRLACAMWWFHPLAWTAARKLRAESERACDDLVLACGARPTDYAQHLLEMVTSVRQHGAPAVAMPMARPKEFEGRMLAILDPSVRRAAPGRAQRAGILASLALLALSIAATTPVRRETVVATPAPTRLEQVQRPASDARFPDAIETRQQARAEARADAKADARADARADAWADARADARAEATAQSDAGEQGWQRTREREIEHAVERAATSVVTSTVTNTVTTILGLVQGRGGVQDTARIATFLRLLKEDKSGEVRKTAAWALHDVKTAAVINALAVAAKGDVDAEVREMAAWALAGTEDGFARASLAFAVRNDRDADVRQAAAWAIGNTRGGDVSVLMDAIGDESSDVRQVAIWGLGTHRSSGTAPAKLVAALADKDEDVRVAAGWALGQIGDPATRDALTNAFLKGASKESREAALWALLRLGEVPRSVIDAALASTDDDLRARAVAMLARGKSGGAWPWPWPWPWPRPEP